MVETPPRAGPSPPHGPARFLSPHARRPRPARPVRRSADRAAPLDALRARPRRPPPRQPIRHGPDRNTGRSRPRSRVRVRGRPRTPWAEPSALQG